MLICYNIIITRSAKRDIVNIRNYMLYTLQQPEVANEFIKGIKNSIKSLQRLPNRYMVIKNDIFTYKEYRCMPYKKFNVFYKVADNRVIILRVIYNKRNWNNLLY